MIDRIRAYSRQQIIDTVKKYSKGRKIFVSAKTEIHNGPKTILAADNLPVPKTFILESLQRGYGFLSALDAKPKLKNELSNTYVVVEIVDNFIFIGA